MSKGDLHKPTPIVKDPKLFKAVDPFKVRDLVTYESIDMKKIAWSLKNYKRSAIYIGTQGSNGSWLPRSVLRREDPR